MFLTAMLVLGACGSRDEDADTTVEAETSSDSTGIAASTGGLPPMTGVNPTTSTTQTSTDPPGDDGGSSDGGGDPLQCRPAIPSACGNPNSIISGRAALPPDFAGATAGDLLVALTHRELGYGASGGIFHWMEVLPAVDLSTGTVDFSLDMCRGGEMWSEENCGYQLTVLLDGNGNNGAENLLPDPGEPSITVDLDLSCAGPPPCFDLELSCTDGSSCVSFVDPGYCSCGPPHTCGSPIVAC